MFKPLRIAGLTLAAALSIASGAAPPATASPGVAVLAEAPPPTDQQLIDAIRLHTASGPPFTIVKVVSPQSDWYVATIRPTTMDQNSLVILQQATGPLTVVAGPGGYFPGVSVPDPVRNYLATVGAM